MPRGGVLPPSHPSGPPRPRLSARLPSRSVIGWHMRSEQSSSSDRTEPICTAWSGVATRSRHGVTRLLADRRDEGAGPGGEGSGGEKETNRCTCEGPRAALLTAHPRPPQPRRSRRTSRGTSRPRPRRSMPPRRCPILASTPSRPRRTRAARSATSWSARWASSPPPAPSRPSPTSSPT